MLSRRLLLTSLLTVVLTCVAVISAAPQTGTAPKAPLTNQDILEMQRTGLSAAIIIAKIQAGPCAFDTSTSALKDLKLAGVTDNITLAMVQASKPPAPTDSGASVANSSESAHLRVYRHHRYEGAALAPSIYVDDKEVTRIGNGRRCSIKLTPGTHSVRSDDKSSAISIDAKPGQEYYIRIDEQTGFWKGHGKLTMVMPEQGKAEYKLQKPVEDDRKIAKDLIEDDGANK